MATPPSPDPLGQPVRSRFPPDLRSLDDWPRVPAIFLFLHRGYAALRAALVLVKVLPHVAILGVDEDEDDWVEEDGDKPQSVRPHPVRHTEHLHQLVDVVGGAGGEEQQREQDHDQSFRAVLL